jgi:hypothetical protein
MSYETDIIKTLAKLGKNSGTENPDSKHNQGRLLGEAFLWDKVEAYARGRSDAAWTSLAREGIIPDKKGLTPGDHELAYSPSFAVIAKVTQPIKRFNGDELARLLSKSKYKVPESTTKELMDQAKIPANPAVTMKVVERS